MAEPKKDLYDLRIQNLNLKSGTITREDIEKYLKSLPDDSEWAEEHPVYDESREVPQDIFAEESSEPVSDEDENT